MTPEEEAAKRLPCPKQHFDGYDMGFTAAACDVCSKRPAVADALRERDERIAQLEDMLHAQVEQGEKDGKRIAILRAALDISYDVERSSGEIRRALDAKLAALDAEVASLRTAERVAAEIAQDQIAAVEGHLRYIAGCHLQDDQQRERIAALEAENKRLRERIAELEAEAQKEFEASAQGQELIALRQRAQREADLVERLAPRVLALEAELRTCHEVEQAGAIRRALDAKLAEARDTALAHAKDCGCGTKIAEEIGALK